MDFQKVFHMTGGVGEISYAKNSILQKTAISKAKPFVEKAIIELYCKTVPQCFTMADLGCSSGPNSLFLVSDIINTIDAVRKKLGHQLPEFQVFLNDLPRNDFNTLFKLCTNFYEQLRKDNGEDFRHCYIAGMPGSFYERLFPSNTLLFVHSSYSVHWLSQVPQGIKNNKGNIYLATTSPQNVFDAYLKQFASDFSSFLRLRSKEIISGGRMVITVMGRRSLDPSSKECCQIWELLARSLRDMVAEDLVEEGEVDSFNLPTYTPNDTEIRNIIQTEGSFHLDLLETFDVNWDATDDPENEDFIFSKITSGQNVAKSVRAVTESILVSHFGEEIIVDLFRRYTEHVSEQLVKDKIKHVNLVMCMTKKG